MGATGALYPNRDPELLRSKRMRVAGTRAAAEGAAPLPLPQLVGLGGAAGLRRIHGGGVDYKNTNARCSLQSTTARR